MYAGWKKLEDGGNVTREKELLTRKEINSETHSCTHSFASLAIFALPGRAFFMIRPTLAICACGVQKENKTPSSDQYETSDAIQP